MKPILHIINNPDDAQAIEIIRIQGKDNAYGVAAVFTGGVPAELPSMPDVRILSLPPPPLNPLPQGEGRYESLPKIPTPQIEKSGGSQGEGGLGCEVISYDDLINLIFSVESISVW